jgi:membrane protease YdiL (CAAX protease family)
MFNYYLPLAFGAFLLLSTPRSATTLPPWLDSLYRLTTHSGPTLVTVFLAWASGDRLADFGLRRVRGWDAAPVILLIIFCGVVAYPAYAAAWEGVFGSTKLSDSSVAEFSRPLGPLDWTVTIGLTAFLAFTEEFVMRGYLIRRLIELTRKPWLAILLSSALFSVYHVYQGVIAVPWTFFLGCVFALSLMVTRSIWPGVVGHFAVNIIITLYWQTAR